MFDLLFSLGLSTIVTIISIYTFIFLLQFSPMTEEDDEEVATLISVYIPD